MSTATNSFRPRKFHDHTIVDDNGRVVGHIRVKPSGVGWTRSDGKKWRSDSLRRFIELMEKHGTLKAK